MRKGLVALVILLAAAAMGLGIRHNKHALRAVPAVPSINPNFSGNRGSPAVAQLDGRTWLMGGWTGTGLLNDVWSTADAAHWTRAAAHSDWRPRGFFEAVSLRDRLFLFGGFRYQPPSNVIGDVWSSRDGVGWTAAPPPPWEEREHFGVVALRDKIVLFGGMTYRDPLPGMMFRMHNDVWTSDDGKSWSRIVEEAPWNGRRGFAFTVFNDRIWLAGGFDAADHRPNDVWSSADGVSWRQEVSAAPWAERGGARLAAFRGRLWLVGGNEDLTGLMGVNDVWSSPDGVNWTQEAAEAPWKGRSGHAMWVEGAGQPDERLCIFGGFNFVPYGEKEFFGDVWSTGDGKTWRQETPLALPDVSPEIHG
jgi:hypothetical protein